MGAIGLVTLDSITEDRVSHPPLASATTPANGSGVPTAAGSSTRPEAPDWLLPTKLAAPSLGGPLDVRARLAPRLEVALQRPLTVVSAPAGFG